MPLIKVAKKKKEQPYVFDEVERPFLRDGILPEEQIRATNHNTKWLLQIKNDEVRDASPEHTERDVYKALERRDRALLLNAVKNLTVAEKNDIVKRIRHSILLSKKEDYLIRTKDDKMLINSEKLAENAKRLLLLDESLDLFDLCIRLDQK